MFEQQARQEEDKKSGAGAEADESGKKGKTKQFALKKKTTLNMNDYKAFKKIKNIESRYIQGKQLGKGAFGIVKKCRHKDTGKSFAIKIMPKK